MWIFGQSGQDGTIYVPMRDTNGAVLTGLAHDSPGAACYYLRPLDAAPTAISLASLATPDAAHTDGGFVEVDPTNMPGIYRLDLPDAVLASGENYVIVSLDFTASRPSYVRLLLDPMPSVVQGTVDDASATAGSFVTDLPGGADDIYNDAFLLVRTGALAGAVRQVTDWVDSSKTISVDPFPAPLANGEEIIVVNR